MFILNFVGIYVYFFIRVVSIKQEMRMALKALPEELLTKLILSPKEFERSRVDDHELKVEGRMYDIARIQLQDNRIIVFCLHDAAEDNLLSFLDAVSSRAHKDKHPIPSTIVQFLSLTFLVPNFTFDALTVDDDSAKTHHNESIKSLPLKVNSPPPRT